MVYKILDDHSDGGSRFRRNNIKSQFELPTIHIKSKSLIANVLIKSIRALLFVYDFISLPIYYALQLIYDDANNDTNRTGSEQVDANTWMQTEGGQHKRRRTGDTYMGSTLSEIFANSIRHYNSRPCLGYRALVTCPMLVEDEDGQHVLQEKSFRSDFTWYTYGQIGRRVQDIVSGLYFHSIYPTSRALFLASTCLEWFCSAQACFQLGVQLVLTPDISDKRALHLVVCETEIDVVFVTCDRLKQLCSLLDTIKLSHLKGPQIKRVVVIDWQFSVDFGERIFAQLGVAAANLVEGVLSMSQIEEAGIENPIEVCCSKALSDDQLNQLILDCDNIYGSSKESNQLSAKSDSNNNNNNNDNSKARHPRKVSVGARGCPTLNIADQLNSNTHDARQHCQTAPPVRRRIKDIANWQQASGLSRNNASKVDGFHQGSASPRPDDLAMIVYTYGRLGQIKPIMLTHSQLVRSSQQLFADQLVDLHDVHCTIISLDNIIEFATEFCVFSHGGSIGYSSNLETLFYDGRELFKRDKSDLEALEPSFLLVKPYVLERLRVSVYSYLEMHLNPLIGFIMKYILVDYKRYWSRRRFRTPLVDWLFCSHLTRLFGPKLRYILCNGATDCSETKDFFAHMVNLPIIELYGPDEAAVSLMSAIAAKQPHCFQGKRMARFRGEHLSDEHEEDPETISDFCNVQLMPPTVNRNTGRRLKNTCRNLLIKSSILCPTLGTRIRLEDWKEFSSSDRPYPRGRLLIGGQDNVCSGYFKRPQLSREAFVCDSNPQLSWFRTDDIVRVFPGGQFEVISAITDMVRMVDGQFVSLSQIEYILKGSRFVDNCCAICVEQDRTFVINLIVPNLRHLALKSPGEASLKGAPSSGPLEPEPEELTNVEFRREVCNDRLMSEFLAEHLARLLSAAGLSEIPVRFLLVPEFWTPESELVTPSMEPKRAAVQRHYATDIQSIVRWQKRQSASSRLRSLGAQGGRRCQKSNRDSIY